MTNLSENLIIIGCPRAGKTTLSNIIIGNDPSYHIISLDSLTVAIKKTMSEVGIQEDSKVGIISKKIVPLLASYLHEYKLDYPNEKFIIEGIQITPEHLLNEPFFRNYRVICLGYPNATIDEIFYSIRNEDKQLSFSYTQEMSDSELRKKISSWIKYSTLLQSKCKEYNILFYETNKNRKKVLNAIFDVLIENNRTVN